MRFSRLFFLAALLVLPGFAYAASAGLSVQVVPAKAPSGNCGTIAGQTGIDAATAGFNTCALYSDWMTPIPNTVGTGLYGPGGPTDPNWVDCNDAASTSYRWYWEMFLYQNTTGSPPLPCAGRIAQVTDPTTGGLALQITFNYSDLVPSNGNIPPQNTNGIQSVNLAASNPYPGPGWYPFAYYETMARIDNNSVPWGEALFWSWVKPFMSRYLIELDFDEIKTEITTGDHCDDGWDKYAPNTIATFGSVWSTESCGSTHYNTVGTLYTSDGTDFAPCVYLGDGVTRMDCMGCQQLSFDSAAVESLERRMLFFQMQAAADLSNKEPNFGTVHYLIQDVKVLTCANWVNTDATGMCPGTTFNGNFYE